MHSEINWPLTTMTVLSLMTSPYALRNKSTVAGVAPIDLKASMGFSTSWPNTSFTSLLLERFWAKLTILLKSRKKIHIWLSLNSNMLKLDAGTKSTMVQITHKIQSYICDHRRRKVRERNLVIWAAQPGPNCQLSWMHCFKIFWPNVCSSNIRNSIIVDTVVRYILKCLGS